MPRRAPIAAPGRLRCVCSWSDRRTWMRGAGASARGPGGRPGVPNVCRRRLVGRMRLVGLAAMLCLTPSLLSCASGRSSEHPPSPVAGQISPVAESESADSLEGTRRVLARLVLEAGALHPGNKVELAVIFEIEEGWHLYWRNPGDSGLPPDVNLFLPAGVTAGEPRWPAPHRHLEADLILDYTFDDHLVLFVPLEVADGAPLGDATIRAELSWLVCRDVCIPGARAVEATFPVTRDPVRPFLPPTDRTLLENARQRIPTTELPNGLTLEWKEETLLLRVPGADGLIFYPYESDAFVYPLDAMERGEVNGGQMILTYPPEVRTVEAVSGVLEVHHAGRLTLHEITIPSPE